MKEGFERLDDLGWIQEIGDRDRYHVLADAYLASTQKKGETLVVCPTHVESDRITKEIRSRLQAAGTLGKSEHEHTSLKPVNLTESQRADPVSYYPGDVLIYHQNARGHRKGSRVLVGKEASRIPTDQAARFTVFRPGTLRLSAGDRVRITKNWTSPDKSTRLNNGDLHTIREIKPDGRIELDSKAVLPAGFGHLDYGYVVTSHSSQARTVERVIIGQSAESLPASTKEQFYVSVSRGRKQCTIFTDDKEALLEAVTHGDSRLTATELLHERDHRERGHTLQRIEQMERQSEPVRGHDPDREVGG